MKNLLCAVAFVALLGGCASSSTSASSSPTQTASTQKTEAEQAREDEILCSRQTRTGSHRKSRVCRTVEQRRRDREEAQRTMDSIQQGGTRAID